MMFHVRHVPSRPKASLRHFNCAVRQYLSRHRTTSQNVTRSFLHSIAFLFRPNTLRSFSILTEPVGRSEKHLLPDGLSIKRKDRTLCGTDNDNIPPRWRWSSASFYCSWLHCCCATLWFLWMAMVIIMVIMVMVNIFYRASATDARYWYSKSVRPSVRPLRSGIRWKRLNVSS